MSLYSELKRRNVFRVAVAYLAAAWLVTEVTETIFPLFGYGDAPARIVVILLAIGFPITLVLSWIYELTPEGLKLEKDIDRAGRTARTDTRRLDRAIIVLLVLALGYFAVDKFVLEPGRVAEIVKETTQQARSEALIESYGEKSIAVLPFTNLSADLEQDFFSDGVAEEILIRLSQLSELRVIGRTSSFQYKGQNLDLREVASELDVAYILEGSVRRSGGRVRIAAHLVRTNDGSGLWSQSYDGDIDDVITMQDEVAESVASSLGVVLDESNRRLMRNVGIRNVEAFVVWQKGERLFIEAHDGRADIQTTLRRANHYFSEATELYPGFGWGWYRQTDYYQHVLMDMGGSSEELVHAYERNSELLSAATEHAQTPQQRAFSSFSRVFFSDDWTGLKTSHRRAVGVQTCFMPMWSEVLSAFGQAPLVHKSMAISQKCRSKHFASLGYRRILETLLYMGQTDEALKLAEEAMLRFGQSDQTSYMRVIALLARGKIAEANTESAMISTANPRLGYWPAIAHKLAGDSEGAAEHWDQYLQSATVGDNLPMTALKFMEMNQELELLAAEIDQRPAGHVILAAEHLGCFCGPLFDLSLTPNFQARLEEGELDWPPVTVIHH